MRTSTVMTASILTASLGFASAASADEEEGLYVGLGLGDYSSEFDDLDDVDIDFDEDSDAKKLFAGWRFNRVFAVQLDYIDFGDTGVNLEPFNIETDTRALAPYVVATLPLGPVELFAKGGVLFYELEVSANGTDIIDETGQDLAYGVGIGVTVIDRLALRAEYEVIDIDELDDAEAVWITAAWRF